MKSVIATRVPSNRRTFLKGAGITSLSLAGAALAGSRFVANEQKVSAATAYSDVDILNFALNLEYLEAEFYAVSTYGATLVELGVITSAEQSGPTTGGNMIKNFGSSPYAYLATALRDDEINHVKYLRTALGSSAVKKPAINLAALGYGYSSVNSWLELARQFEEVGMSAYLGAAPLISSSTYLAAAGAILVTESQHSGALRMACIGAGVNSPAVDSLDEPPTPSAPFHVTSMGLSVPRTPAEVLKVVYAGGDCSGGFYPDGMNGGIVCQSE
jgi:Ferritin-like domain